VADAAELRARARAAWAAGDWDAFSRRLEPIGETVLGRSSLSPGMDVLDVGTGSGGTIAIPAARRGARVVGADITPELLERARGRAADAGIEVRWIEADAQLLPFADASFDRVFSTVGAIFAPDHERAAAELVRVCRPGGRVLMTAWAQGGFTDALFALSASFVAPPGRWAQFEREFAALVERYDEGGAGEARIRADYLLIAVER
jgi:ubiquinone/menaquinone biosynthesis C-methylase UbiE